MVPTGSAAIDGGKNEFNFWEKLCILRDRLISKTEFQNTVSKIPLINRIAKKRANQIFDLMAGFVYTQILLSCVRINIFNLLKDGPQDIISLQKYCSLEVDGLKKLLDAAVSINLLEIRSKERYGLGILGAPMVGNEALSAMIEHHTVLYEDLKDPLLLLSGGIKSKNLEKFWPYVSSNERDQESLLDKERVKNYSDLMTASLPLVADQVVDVYDFSRHVCLLDVGGGQGTFLKRVHANAPKLKRMLFDLPGVANLARDNFLRDQNQNDIQVHEGDFFKNPLPHGADLITLIRVIFDHDDERVKILLRSIYEALPQKGKLLIAEPMADTPSHPAMGHAYFGFYLLAMGRGRPRTISEITALATGVGFRKVEVLPSNMPINAQVLLISR